MALMRRTVLLAAMLIAAAAAAPGQQKTDQCFVCHEAIQDKPSQLFARDVHRAKGITCAGCHGGNDRAEEMEVGMDAKAGFVGVPKGNAISAACESCHSNAERMKSFGSSLPVNQGQNLRESVHGRLSMTGKEQLVQCTTCHGAHGVSRVKEKASPVHPLNVTATCAQCHSSAAFMRNYNPALPIDQLEKYRTSVHGVLHAKGDSRVAECASCHGSHEIRAANDIKSKVFATNLPATCAACHSDAVRMKPYKIPVNQFEGFARSVHGKALLERHDLGAPACNDCHGNHGATPPGVQSISQVCGTCHALNADLFSSSPHKKAFDSRNLPECETCHGNHEIVAATESLLGTASEAVCSKCHTATESPAGFLAARTMRSLVDSLDHAESKARSLVEEAEQKGMEISEEKFKLRDVRQARLESRTTVHAFDEAKLREVTDRGITSAAGIAEKAREAVEEYYFRRWGLGISTIIISIVAFSLYLTIKNIERKQKAKGL